MLTYTFDSTMLNNIVCGRKGNFAHNKHLKQRTGAPSYFDYGELGHYALRIYYQGIYDGLTYTQAKDKCIEESRSFYTQNLTLEVAECEEALKTVEQYLSYHQNDSWYPLKIEQPFAVEVFRDEELEINGQNGLRLVAEGVIDLEVRTENGEEVIVDHKFISRNREPDKLGYQPMLYCVAYNKRKIIYNHIGKQKTLKPDEKFTRHTRFYSESLLKEFINETVFKVLRWMKDDEEGTYLPEFTSCDKFSGCIYRKICETEIGMRPQIIEMYYKEGVPWSPWTRR